ncbi:uncharacterized protein LOC120071260 isoform X2 [Benincasa hispida]|uniref:uncharacterized protein LOC120071260 isoform X2 n=1 Tax=Benincasa hispida TaxID=102211 RepID=UPI0018FF5BB5|nr:uncharacterized protein LOC120071260 isoform X2 [Benincasa hispida]
MDSTALGSITTSSSLLSWSQGMKLKQCIETSKFFGKADRCVLLKQKIQLSVGTPSRCGSKFKLLRISAFKNSVPNGEPRDGENLSEVPKDTREDGDVSSKVNLKANNVVLSYTSGIVNWIAPRPSINKLFRKWPTMLCTQQASEEVDGILGRMPLSENSATLQEPHDMKRRESLEAFWYYVLSLDPMIKIPLLMFIPLYLTIKIFHGAQVSKELMPLWVFGPFIVAFYIKMFHWLCCLSILSFKQTAYLMKNFPCYYKLACDYFSHGRLKEVIRARVWQPVVNIRSLHYKELSRRKFEIVQEWIMERYPDFLELVWPYYCRTIRFLKRANFV